MKCLLVDDEPGIREGLAALLRRRGHDVRTAGDFASARALLAEHDFAAVVTDWRLPDGTAAELVAAAACPVIAVSGHPDEVAAAAPLHAVLAKPVAPSRLLELLAGAIGAAAAAPASAPPAPQAAGPLPADVGAVVAAAREIFGPAAPVQVDDDGTFVLLRAPLADDSVLPRLHDLGGDLRVLAPRGQPRVELRLCRDGRPDPGLPVFAPADAWPVDGEFAVDFDGTDIAPPRFAGCLERARRCREAGATVHFLNVPEPLRIWASVSGRSGDLPMRAKPGPRLPAILVDLWS